MKQTFIISPPQEIELDATSTIAQKLKGKLELI